jgi:hypothetical protein
MQDMKYCYLFPNETAANFWDWLANRQTRTEEGISIKHEDGVMGERRRIKHVSTFEERLAEEAHRLRVQAKKLQHGRERDELLRKARQAETASHLSEWLASPGLQPPKPG